MDRRNMAGPKGGKSTSSEALTDAVRSSKAPAISRAVAILRLLGKSETPQRLQAVARELGLVPSTCLYVLRALVDEELVAFDPDTKRYSLDAGVLTLASHWLRRNAFTHLAQPQLDRISRDCGVTTLGVQIVGLEHIIVVADAQSGANFQISAQVGSRFPALISATGRCIAAFSDCPEAELRERFAELRWDDPPSFRAWLAEVGEARSRGYAVDPGNYLAGVTVLAAPVWKDRGAPSHAVVALALGADLPRKRLAQIGEALLEASGSLSLQLGGGPD
jgi:DNA-binding IclR family transcriptional regulator